jgi:signal transduction histidine kinase
LQVSTLIHTQKLSLKDYTDLKILLVAVLYYFSAHLGYYLAFENTTTLPTWPPSGIAFGLTILMGRRTWPGITIGSLIANLLSYWNNPELPTHSVMLISSGIAIGNTIEPVLGNYLLQFLVKDNYPFNTANNAFRFLFVTLIMCFAGAGIGNYVLMINGVIGEDIILRSMFLSWVSNVVGILLFTPFVLSVFQKPSVSITPEKIVEIAIFLFFALAIYIFLQIDYVAVTFQHALPFLVLPFLLWAAFRFNLTIATCGVMATSLWAVYITTKSQGPFLMVDAYNSILLLQIFIGVVSISTIVLSSTVKERRIAKKQLMEFTATLESKVHERTKLLKEEIHIRKLAEQKIHKANEELSKRNTELDNFVYSVSHDLRSPIASVLGLINLARKDRDPNMKDTYLEMINKSALQQDHFIKEILDQSRNSRLEVKCEEVFFAPLIDETFNQMKFSTHSMDFVEKIINIEQKTVFYSDRWRLKVILNNIISNSIRYRNGRDPQIKINVFLDEHVAHITISDNGKGIDKEHLPNLYKMFYRATDDGAGSGLGLYIVKEAIDKLNGRISIESELHVGTTVRLSIPQIRNIALE